MLKTLAFGVCIVSLLNGNIYAAMLFGLLGVLLIDGAGGGSSGGGGSSYEHKGNSDWMRTTDGDLEAHRRNKGK